MSYRSEHWYDEPRPDGATPALPIPGKRTLLESLTPRVAQPKLTVGAGGAADVAPTGGGEPLAGSVRGRMEPLFDMPLGDVRVVQSGQPEQLGARAFALGNEIHAARGEDLQGPGSSALLGHELAHVAQQRQGRVGGAQGYGGAVVVDAALETEADEAGARVARGEPAGIGGAGGGAPGAVAQGYRIDVTEGADRFATADALITALTGTGHTPNAGWTADHRARLYEWMRGDRVFASRAALKTALDTAAALPAAGALANAGDLIARFNMIQHCGSAAEVNTFVGNRRAITQVPQERGDMFDVASALALDGNLRVVFLLSGGRLDDAAAILDFYRGAAARVCLVTDGTTRQQLQAQGAGVGQRYLSVSQSTQTMVQHRRDDDFRGDVADAMTGGAVNPNDAAAFDEELARHHIQRGTNYALVMYRDSGHNPGHGRAPSHPELDTGTQGYEDLIQAVTATGRTPVAVGTRAPNGFDGAHDPNLINYWAWDCFRAYPAGTIRRQKENALMRHLAANYNVVAVGMRSGGMDVLAYVGIPILSIDIASEFMPQRERQAHHISDGSSKSWRRAAKKELAFGDRYHNVYLSGLRDDRHHANTGAISGHDQGEITGAARFYFDDRPDSTALDPTSPLHARNVTELAQQRDHNDAVFNRTYADSPALYDIAVCGRDAGDQARSASRMADRAEDVARDARHARDVREAEGLARRARDAATDADDCVRRAGDALARARGLRDDVRDALRDRADGLIEALSDHVADARRSRNHAEDSRADCERYLAAMRERDGEGGRDDRRGRGRDDRDPRDRRDRRDRSPERRV